MTIPEYGSTLSQGEETERAFPSPQLSFCAAVQGHVNKLTMHLVATFHACKQLEGSSKPSHLFLQKCTQTGAYTLFGSFQQLGTVACGFM